MLQAHPLHSVAFSKHQSKLQSRSVQCSALGRGNWSSAIPGELPLRKDGSVDELSSIGDFTRFYENDEGCELQTAVVSYYARPQHRFPWDFFQAPQQVDLVAAVHIADKQYFEEMQRELDKYDCVLYEMVADKDENKSRGGRKKRWKPSKKRRRGFKFSIISLIQQSMARVLNLDFQLECMDYQKDNWYHADLDFKTFIELQKEKGESLLGFAAELTKLSSAAISAAVLARNDLDPFRGKLLWASRVFPMPLLGLFIIEGVCAPAPLVTSPEIKALFNLDIGGALKVFLAKQLSADISDGAFALLKDSVIIGERNRVAMEEVRVAINEECHERVAVFYGSGHLPDLDSRLRAMGFHPEKVRWQTAWSIQGKGKASEEEVSPLRALAQVTGWPLNRYQTVSIALLSTVLAIDLWFWELFLEGIQDVVQNVAVRFPYL